MITYHERQTIEMPIKDGQGGNLLKAMLYLASKYDGLFCSILKKTIGRKKNFESRSHQLDEWLKSSEFRSFIFELFVSKNKNKFCIVVEVKNISMLGTKFGKRHRRRCKGYISLSAFCEKQSAIKYIHMFYKDIEKSIKKSFDLKKIPPMTSVTARNKVFKSLEKRTKCIKEPSKFVLSSIGTLKNRNIRDIILRIKAMRVPTISNITKSSKLNQSHVRKIVGVAIKGNLLKKEYNIICAKCKKVIARVSNRKAIARMADERVSCPACATKIRNTSREEIFLVPPEIKNLVDGSKWLSIYVREKLLSLGVPRKRMLVGVIDGPHEIDLVANIQGGLLLMEFKDKRFSIGEAYPFVGKCSKYKPETSFIISTDGIDSDVEEYIKAVGIPTHYVGNLDKLDEQLSSFFSDMYEKQLLRLVGQMNLDELFSGVIFEFFNFSKKLREQNKDIINANWTYPLR